MDLEFKGPSRYSNYETGSSVPDLETLIKLAKYFDVSIDDLLHKDLSQQDSNLSVMEDQVKYETTKKQEILTVTLDTDGNAAIPMLNIQAAAGWAGNTDNTHYLEKLPAVTMPMQEYRSGDWALIQARGESMETTIYHGQWLMCKRIHDYNDIKDNNVFVVLLRDGPVVKRVLNRVKKRGTLVLQSDNPAYQLVEVNFAEDVLQVWNVQMTWVFDLHNKNLDIYKDVQALKEELMLLKKSLSKKAN